MIQDGPRIKLPACTGACTSAHVELRRTQKHGSEAITKAYRNTETYDGLLCRLS
jgi:hypothetical protein